MENLNILAENIKKIRLHENLTQEEFANLFGISKMSLRRYENGDRVPLVEFIIKICKKYGVTLDALYSKDFKPELQSFDTPEDFEKVWKEITEKDAPQIKISHKSTGEQQYEVIPSKKELLLSHFEKLNMDGKEKLVEHAEMLTKIPEYRKDNE